MKDAISAKEMKAEIMENDNCRPMLTFS